MQKARRHPKINFRLRPLVGVRFQVLFHSLIQGTFHLSLTVLVHYRSLRSIQPYRMVPADSGRIPPVPPYSGYCSYSPLYMYATFTLFGSSFQMILFKSEYYMQSYNPTRARSHGLGCSPFARHYLGNHSYFLFLRLLRCFSSAGWPPDQRDDTSSMYRVVPFGNLRI